MQAVPVKALSRKCGQAGACCLGQVLGPCKAVPCAVQQRPRAQMQGSTHFGNLQLHAPPVVLPCLLSLHTPVSCIVKICDKIDEHMLLLCIHKHQHAYLELHGCSTLQTQTCCQVHN